MEVVFEEIEYIYAYLYTSIEYKVLVLVILLHICLYTEVTSYVEYDPVPNFAEADLLKTNQ